MKQVLEVTGMRCGSCEGLVNDELVAMEGVIAVAAHAHSNTVEVELDGSRVAIEDITALIADLGFQPVI